MHTYLKAIGFSEFSTKKQIDDFFNNNLKETNLISTFKTNDDRIIGQYNIMVCSGCGISVIGEEVKGELSLKDYYFPFLKGYDFTVVEECLIERHSDKESFAGVIDDYRLGMALIFYLNNINEYNIIANKYKVNEIRVDRIFLSALSINGKVILPLDKKNNDLLGRFSKPIIKKEIYDDANKDDANSDLDIEVFDNVFERYKTEDLYSIVETSIVPFGIECDKYSIVANILSVSNKVNEYTKEKLYELRVEALGLEFNIMINEKDLVGVPTPNRRFVGIVWLQGEVKFTINSSSNDLNNIK